MTKLETGTRVADMILVERIGAGSFGEVWKAIHTKESRLTAVKFAVSDEARLALLRDGVPHRGLAHPSIVRVLAVETAAEPPYVVMEHVEGKTLRQLLRERGRLEPQDVGSIFRQLTDALAHAHERGVVHGDVKPENILVIEQGMHLVVKLTDFQVGAPRAASLSPETHGVRPSLRSAVVSGTYHYLAPEQETGQAVDGRADIFALGVVLFEMATGALPRGRDLPSEVNPALSWWWDQIFSRCYAGIERRYKDTEELRLDLRAVYAGAPAWGRLPSQIAGAPAPSRLTAAESAALAAEYPNRFAAFPVDAFPDLAARSPSLSFAQLGVFVGVPIVLIVTTVLGAAAVSMKHRARARAAMYRTEAVERESGCCEIARPVRSVGTTNREQRLYGTVPSYRERAEQARREAEERAARHEAEREEARAREEREAAALEEERARQQAEREAARAEREAGLAERRAALDALSDEFSILLRLYRETPPGPGRDDVARELESVAQRARGQGYVLDHDARGEPILAPRKR